MKPSLKMPFEDAMALVMEARSTLQMARILAEIAECAFQLGYQLGRKPAPKLRQIAPGIMAMELQDCAELAELLSSLDPATPVYDASELCPDGLRELGRAMGQETMNKPSSNLRVVYEPAECVPDCPSHDCHYMHRDAWTVFRGDDRMSSYSTKTEAEDAIKRHTPQSRKRTKLGFI